MKKRIIPTLLVIPFFFIVSSQLIRANQLAMIHTTDDHQKTRGCTHRFVELDGLVSIGEAPVYVPLLKKPRQLKPYHVNAPLLKSTQLDFYLEAGKCFAVQFDHQSKALNCIYPDPDNPFSETVLAALEKAPQWLENDLMNIFSRLKPEHQTLWANAILTADDPYVDEIAFCIAHLSPQYLMSGYASVQLLVDNARLIYQNDQYLDYVEVLDYGSSHTDLNYYSTTKYRKAKLVDTLEVEVPRDIYYWYIVHPKISDEIPAYIDPDVIEDSRSHNNNITTSEGGYFWRDFLFYQADPGYAKLKDLLKGCKIVWNKFGGSVNLGSAHALDAMNRWLGRSMEFTSNEERPHQPVRIYRKHIGRCGENSDMRVAIARAALIPATGVASYSTDHVWNEFWDEGWIHWDGDIDKPYMYVDSWGKKFGSVIKWRSDGFFTSVTDKYARSHSKLNIYALDSLDNPIDGAQIWLYTTGLDDNLWFDNYSITDISGKATFIVGTDRKYHARMRCDYGSVPVNADHLLRVVSNSQPNKEYTVSLSVPAIKPVSQGEEISVPQFQDNRYYLEVDFKIPSQIIRGIDIFDDMELNAYQFIEKTGGTTNFMILDEMNYQNLLVNNKFQGFHVLSEIDSSKTGFEFNEPSNWYCVFDNTPALHTLQHIVASVNLYSMYAPEIPQVYILQNYPNPVNPQKYATTITYQLPQKSKVEITIYNLLGQKVKTLLNTIRYAGSFDVEWDGKNELNQWVASGIYVCKIKTEHGEASRKMLVVF